MAIDDIPDQKHDEFGSAEDILASVQAGIRNLQRYPVPDASADDGAFKDGAEYCEAHDLEALAAGLMDKYPYFAWLRDRVILYRWKRKGGKNGGKLKAGACKKLGGEIAFETGADYYVWLAADHLKDAEVTYFQVEALLAHELCHPSIGNNGEMTTQAHDVEEFSFIVANYGLYKTDLLTFGQVVRQLRLPEAGT